MLGRDDVVGCDEVLGRVDVSGREDVVGSEEELGTLELEATRRVADREAAAMAGRIGLSFPPFDASSIGE